MNNTERESALLALIAEDLRRQRDEILRPAQEQARELLHAAHEHARERVRSALDDARRRWRTRLAQAQAQRQTRIRRAEQEHARSLLAAALEHLPQLCAERWAQAAPRLSWVTHALASARQLLGSGDWQIKHALGLSADECRALTARLAAEPGVACQWQADPDLRAGVHIRCNGNVVDASLRGLMADRDTLAAAVLQKLAELSA